MSMNGIWQGAIGMDDAGMKTSDGKYGGCKNMVWHGYGCTVWQSLRSDRIGFMHNPKRLLLF